MNRGPTIRLRLTAWYAAIFLASGAVLLAGSYFVVREQFTPQIEMRPAPASEGGASVVVPGPSRPPDSGADTEQPAAPGGGQEEEVAQAQRAADVERRVREDERARDVQALRNVLAWFAALLGAMTLVSVGLGWLVAGRALAPVSRIAGAARRVSGRSLNERIDLDGPHDELKDLADTFDAMLGRLEAAFDSQRRFVANASHELRTPLAIIRAELEELLDTSPTAGEQAMMLANAKAAAARSERLIDSLLTLARSDGGLDARRPVDLAVLVHGALGTDRCQPRDDIAVTADLQPADVDGDPVLLESLVVNLLENAVRHNRAGGSVYVTTRSDGDAQLVVANTGQQLHPGEIDRLFSPFQRRDRASDGSDRGFGLGLSIVKAVATAHGGRVEAAASDAGGLTVTVRLPLAGDGRLLADAGSDLTVV